MTLFRAVNFRQAIRESRGFKIYAERYYICELAQTLENAAFAFAFCHFTFEMWSFLSNDSRSIVCERGAWRALGNFYANAGFSVVFVIARNSGGKLRIISCILLSKGFVYSTAEKPLKLSENTNFCKLVFKQVFSSI